MGALINKDKRLLFIHNKKCGGTSIRNVLKKNGFKAYNRPNKPYDKTVKKKWLDSEIGLLDFLKIEGFNTDGYFIFTSVRDPYDRFASFFQNYRNGNEKIEQFIKRFLSCREKDSKSSQVRPALSYHGDPFSPNLKCDFIINLNNINVDWDKLKELTGIVGNIPHLHKKAYNKNTKNKKGLIDFVNDFYKEDIKNYNKLNE